MKNKKGFILFCLVALVQVSIPLSMIYRSEKTLENGKVFLFKTAPVDPYDAFRGKYVQLGFEHSRVSTNLPHGSFRGGEKAYLLIRLLAKLNYNDLQIHYQS